MVSERVVGTMPDGSDRGTDDELRTTPVARFPSTPASTTNHTDRASISEESTWPNQAPTGASYSAKNTSMAAGLTDPPSRPATTLVACEVTADRPRAGVTSRPSGRATNAPSAISWVSANRQRGNGAARVEGVRVEVVRAETGRVEGVRAEGNAVAADTPDVGSRNWGTRNRVEMATARSVPDPSVGDCRTEVGRAAIVVDARVLETRSKRELGCTESSAPADRWSLRSCCTTQADRTAPSKLIARTDLRRRLRRARNVGGCDDRNDETTQQN
jgi:hypothetical protein